MYNVILDSNILHEEGFHSNDMRMLKGLIDDNLVAVHLPELVCREFLTHRSYKIIDALDRARKEINSVERDVKQISSTISESINTLKDCIQSETESIEGLVEGSFNEWLKEYSVRVIELDVNTTPGVFDDYFKGLGAFRDKKKRDDIPDAFINKAISSLIDTVGDVTVIIKDREFTRHLRGNPNVAVLNNLRDLFNYDGLGKSLANAEVRSFIASTEFSHAIEEYLEMQPQGLGEHYFENEEIDGSEIIDVFLMNLSVELDSLDSIDIISMENIRSINDSEFSAIFKFQMNAGVSYVTDYGSVLALEKMKNRRPAVWSMNGDGICDVSESARLEVVGDLKVIINDRSHFTGRAEVLEDLIQKNTNISLEVKNVEVIELLL